MPNRLIVFGVMPGSFLYRKFRCHPAKNTDGQERGVLGLVKDDGFVALLGILGKLSQSRIPMKGTNGFPVNSSKIWMSGIQ